MCEVEKLAMKASLISTNPSAQVDQNFLLTQT